VEAQRPVTEDVSTKPKPPLVRIPPGERELSDQPVGGVFAPSFEALEQDFAVGRSARALAGDPERAAKIVAVVEPQVRDQAVRPAAKREPIIGILGQKRVQGSAKRDNTVVGLRGLRAVGALAGEDPRACIAGGPAIERPIAGNGGQTISPEGERDRGGEAPPAVSVLHLPNL
jgi:hypothetical protein